MVIVDSQALARPVWSPLPGVVAESANPLPAKVR